jgi:hypothetical protein
MSVLFSGTFSGRFVSTGAATFIPLPSGVDWMVVTNETVSYASGAGSGAKFEWVNGDTVGRGTIYTKESTIGALVPSQIAVASGFYFMDTTIPTFGVLNNGSTAITAISTATPPVVTTGSTAGMATGNIVRLYDVTGANQLNGYDFSITVLSSTTFSLTNMSTLGAAATAGNFRVISPAYFYPPERDITNIQLSSVGTVPAGTTRITMGVSNVLYTVGQRVNIIVPSTVWGTIELNNVNGTIVAVGIADANGSTNTIDINVNSASFTTFTFPVTGGPSFSPAQVIPLGETTAQAIASGVNVIGDATINTGQRGMLLQAGASSPAGVSTNVITWIAGKSFNQ